MSTTVTAPAPPARHLRGWPEPGSFAAGSVVTMGVFDGFHRGHQELVARATARSRALRVPTVLVTFDPHPLVVTCPERAPRQLLGIEQRVDRALDLGIEHVLVLPFDKSMAATPAEDFVRDGLVGRLGVRHVVVGENFRFGRCGAGDTDFLAEWGQWAGFTVDAVPLVQHAGRVCSSTAVRRLLEAGDRDTAGRLLGRSANRVLAAV